MSRRRTWPGLAALLSLACLPVLAGCGIQGSDVVEAGGPAPVTVQPTASPRVVLFFTGKDGRLMMVLRSVGFFPDPASSAGTGRGVDPTFPADGSDRIAADKVLTALLEGPAAEERAAGLTTRLSFHGRGEPHLTLPVPNGPRQLSLRVAVRVRDLDPVAVQQLVCTAAYAEGEKFGTGIPVVVSGTDGALPATSCEVS
ncbi:hypothetical protein KV205_03785 [Streptomyces sp. SKN60]|uniref:hypothetical protein n=1 Tax=Streptomyces sp. SKN60 TaxID=2855506 RepID=UPI002247B7C1|nr:hypothetical protein [Streptomyces sp. SKN60]MCX2179655.1 hypothetical protein [Streptomyces sp. SKN60]